MSVQVWVGEIPEHSQEREAIVALARGLARMEDLYLVLANFTVGGQAIDLAIFKRNGGFIIELKHCDGKVIGAVNGRWEVISSNGEVHLINPDRRNPYNQVISYFYRLSNFLNAHRSDFLSEHRAASVDFRTCKRLVVIAPEVHPESEIVLDWKVDLKGLDELPTYLVTTTSSEIDLSDDELLAIPKLLRCEPWRDINLLINGEGPAPEVVAPIQEVVVAQVVEAPAEEEAPHKPWLRLSWRMSIFAVTLVALVGLGVKFLLPLVNGPRPTASPTVTIQIPPTLTGTAGVERTPTVPIKEVEQPIERDNNLAGGVVQVVLRTVEFYPDKIVVHWEMTNKGTRPVKFPLNSKTVVINDNIKNLYPVADALSEPRVLYAGPGERVEGTLTVSRPVSPDAITLTIRVYGEEPFPGGDAAVWFLNIPGRE